MNSYILSLDGTDVKRLSFQQKQYWFRNKLEKKRISWKNGADYMKIQRSNILMSSLIEYKKINMQKKVKIEFIGEKVNDACGLFRQQIHMVIKQIFDQITGIFMIANTDDVMYKLKWDEDLDQQFPVKLFQLLAQLLPKQFSKKFRYSVTQIVLFFLKFVKMLLKYKIFMDTINNYINIGHIFFKMNTLTIQKHTLLSLKIQVIDTVQQIQLIQNGKNTLATSKNKFQYVNLCVQVQIMNKVKRSIDSIKKGISRIIPDKILNVFESYQFEMFLYGVPFIDLKDWRENTIYENPYNENHQIIKWFWETIDQECVTLMYRIIQEFFLLYQQLIAELKPELIIKHQILSCLLL